MANALGTNPMVVDTAMATPFKTPVKVSSIIWADATTIGHKLIVLDANGNKVIQATQTVANQPIAINLIDSWFPNGFKVTQIDSGVLYIYVD